MDPSSWENEGKVVACCYTWVAAVAVVGDDDGDDGDVADVGGVFAAAGD